jgi:hypothetical protein
MWIMIIKKLNIQVSPPKMSIFWSTPLGDHKYANDQIKEFLKDKEWEDFGVDADFDRDENGKQLDQNTLWEKAKTYLSTRMWGIGRGNLFGNEHNWTGARQILYKEQQITVFPDEFSVIQHENMALYLGLRDEEASHELVPSSVSDKEIATDILEGPRKEVYDAALVDGASKEQAYAMALGVDISSEYFTADFPAVGWYRCKPQYAEYYCYEWEMAE